MLNPRALFWALLAVPIVLLYLWTSRPRRRSVSTGFIWERVFEAADYRSAWWSFRHPVSLCLHLVILALLVLALAEPQSRPPGRLVLVIDNSASMNATDAQPTRLDQARELARQHVQALGCHDQMAIITAGDTVRMQCRPTSRRDVLLEGLRTVASTDGPTRVVDAVGSARQILGERRNGKILVLTDGCFDGAAELAQQEDVQLIAVGQESDNVAVTGLSARRSPADPLKCQVMAEVTSYSKEPVECRLKFELNGRPIAAVPVELGAGGRWRQVFEMTTAEGGRMTAAIDPPDVFKDDDQASATVPPCQKRRVTLVTGGNLFLETALRANSLADLTVTDTAPERVAKDTILVFHGRVPVALPEGPTLVIDPIGTCQLWELGDPPTSPIIAKQNDNVSLLADVRLDGVRVSQVKRLVPTDRAREVAQPVAWTADGVAVGYAIDRAEGRVLVLSGILEGGDLPLRAAFPILIANALEWVAAAGNGSAHSNVGWVEARDPRGRSVEGRAARGPQETGGTWVSCLDPPYTPDPPHTRLASAPAGRRESNLHVPDGLASQQETSLAGSSGPPFWLFPAAVALLLVVAEWCLFQRRWTC